MSLKSTTHPFPKLPTHGLALTALATLTALSMSNSLGCSDDGTNNQNSTSSSSTGSGGSGGSGGGSGGGGAGGGGGGFVDTTTFVDPPAWAPDANGVYQLRVETAEVTIDGRTLCLRTFNGAVPAPTLRIAAPTEERQVRVDFENALKTEDQQPVGPPGPGATTYDFNRTNLHTHGLHVQPEMSSDGLYLADNVLIHHAAGAKAQYRFDIDEDMIKRGRPHEPGTFWYHPHVHGSTAIQVANGMAGAIIIEGDVDKLAGIADSRERIFVMTHMPIETALPLPAGTTCDESALSINAFNLVAAAPMSVQVNGVVKPRIVVPPGQIERWRFIHGGVTQEMNLGLYKSTDNTCSDIQGQALTVNQIAQDGITFHAMDQRQGVFLSPGNRADIMMTAPAEEGVYCLAYEQAGGPPGSPATTMVVAILETNAEAGTPTGALPTDADLDSVALPLLDCASAPDGTQGLIFSQQTDPNTGALCDGVPVGGGLGFNINCKSFNPDTPRVLTVEKIEDWNVSSEAADHPMHIHVNPFMVCDGSINGEAAKPHWRDTIFVRQPDGLLRLRMFYETYTGSFVTHCHKLHHEDQGMMEVIRIDP